MTKHSIPYRPSHILIFMRTHKSSTTLIILRNRCQTLHTFKHLPYIFPRLRTTLHIQTLQFLRQSHCSPKFNRPLQITFITDYQNLTFPQCLPSHLHHLLMPVKHILK